jgi:hypothetical protein
MEMKMNEGYSYKDYQNESDIEEEYDELLAEDDYREEI